MTEDQAREVVWLLARDATPAAGGVAWTPEDGAWATRQALAAVGERASPEAFVLARTRLALGRLLPRDAAGQRFVARRVWRPLWVPVATGAGVLLGLMADQLGNPQHVNLLAPAVWALVLWNLAVYAWAVWPLRGFPWRAQPGASSVGSPNRSPGRLQEPAPGLGLLQGQGGPADGPTQLWLRLAAPLTAQRAALLLHGAAAGLGLGLVAGLYLRGLVLDYRVGWQSTFLDASAVQAGLGLLLAPAHALTGWPVPSVEAIAALRLAPGATAVAPAATWIHLYALTLLLWVVLPRAALAAWAAWRARGLSRRFPLPLDLPGLRSLHPLMRPGASPAVRLLWAAPPQLPPLRLLHADVDAPSAPLALWRSDAGDVLELVPVPAGLRLAPAEPAVVATGPAPERASQADPPGWARWRAAWRAVLRPAADPLTRQLADLATTIDAVLWVAAAGAARPPWLAALGRPVVTLWASPAASAAPPSDVAASVSLQARSDGWLREGALLQALQAALPDDDRVPRLAAQWQACQARELARAVAILAEGLARVAVARAVLPEPGLLGRADDGTIARQALADELTAIVDATLQRLATSLGLDGPAPQTAKPTATPTVHGRVGEGRAAVVGAMLTGAVTGLKADLLSGGLTLGAGAVAGGVLGALGAAGAARGLNAARGTTQSHAAWGDEAVGPLVLGLLGPYLQWVHGLSAEQAAARLAPVLTPNPTASRTARFTWPAGAAAPEAEGAVLAALQSAWHRRPDAAAVATALGPALERAVRQALGGP